MKILRKEDDFKKMPEKDAKDILAIENLVKQGWSYCSKETFKEFFKKTDRKKPELIEEKRKETEVKVYNKPEKKKIERKPKSEKKKRK